VTDSLSEQILTPTLRPHQVEAVDALAFSQEVTAYAEMSVASGKSLVMAKLGERAIVNTRVLIIAHTEELVQQDAHACRWIGQDPAICSAGLNETRTDGRLTVGTIGTIANRLDCFKNVGLVIIDEIHRARMTPYKDGTVSEYLKVQQALPKAWFRGVTATGWREDGTGSLENTFGKRIFEYGFLQALEDGFVKMLRAVAADAPDIDTKGLKVNSLGEWGGQELTHRGVALAPLHVASLVKAMREEERTRCLIFACDIEHANVLEREYRKLGIDARAVHTGVGGRVENVEAFRRGDFPVMISVAMFNTGFDVPDVDMMGFCRPMKSSLLYAQSLGRGARLSEYADDCAVVDFGGNIVRHGALDMIEPPKQRAPSGSGPKEEREKLPAMKRAVGGDLRNAAKEGVLLSNQGKPQWTKPNGVPIFLPQRGFWIVPTKLGKARWFSRSYPNDVAHLYCEYRGKYGWTARGAVDIVGILHKA
jgi:DNA repair protein RadD